MPYAEKLKSFISRPSYAGECQRLFQAMKVNCSPDGPVLDVGCGVGGMINFHEENGTNVFGIDPGCHLYGLKLRRSRTCQGFGENIPFASQTFEAVYFMHSFAHLVDTPATLQEVRRVLKPNGFLYMVTPNSQFESLTRPVKKVLEKAGVYHPDTTVTGHYSPRELRRTLESVNFDVLNVSTFGLAGFQRIIVSAQNRH
jgi:ubiquinone/menaquinone biosynthesis C-methylase UbiE